jgi:hypothetical protein
MPKISNCQTSKGNLKFSSSRKEARRSQLPHDSRRASVAEGTNEYNSKKSGTGAIEERASSNENKPSE